MGTRWAACGVVSAGHARKRELGSMAPTLNPPFSAHTSVPSPSRLHPCPPLQRTDGHSWDVKLEAKEFLQHAAVQRAVTQTILPQIGMSGE